MKRINFTPRISPIQQEFAKRRKRAIKKRTGDWFLHYVITPIAFLLLFLPIIIILNIHVSKWLYFPFSFITGLGMILIGTCVVHDANHDVFSSKKWVNEIFSNSIYLIFGNKIVWRLKHNVRHHGFTGIENHDHDLGNGVLLRFAKEQVRKKWHKYQHIYAPVLYAQLTLFWFFWKDASDLHDFTKNESLRERINKWSNLIFTKSAYLFFWIGLPIIFTEYGILSILLFFLVMHWVCGFVLSHFFQPAHVMPNTETYSETDSSRDNWFIHQLKTSSNFCTGNSFLFTVSGGLTHQKEHHIVFQSISHRHYKKIEKILRELCAEYRIEYLEYKTLKQTISAHYSHLKSLGTTIA